MELDLLQSQLNSRINTQIQNLHHMLLVANLKKKKLSLTLTETSRLSSNWQKLK